MTNFKQENERFCNMFKQMTQETKNKIRGEENPRTEAEDQSIYVEAQKISTNISNRTKIYNKANDILKSALGKDINDIVLHFKQGDILFVDAELLSKEEWQELNDILWSRKSIKFIEYNDKMRLTQVASSDRLIKIENETDEKAQAQEMLALQKSLERGN